MHKTNKSRAEKLAREVRRRDAKIDVMQKENAALLKRALDAERAARLLSESMLRLNIRVGLAYGEDVMDEARGKSIGKRFTLPALTDEEAEGLLRKWQSKAMKDEHGNVNIAVGLRDDPDDHKTDTELAEEAEGVPYATSGYAEVKEQKTPPELCEKCLHYRIVKDERGDFNECDYDFAGVDGFDKVNEIVTACDDFEAAKEGKDDE